MVKCSKCAKPLGVGEQNRPVAVICASVMGDEYIESWYFCAECQVYTLEVYHDRFSGEDDVSVRGPIEKARGDAKVALIQRCPKPNRKRCTCAAHNEYFGNWLDSSDDSGDEVTAAGAATVDPKVKQEFARIERENRDFWSRMLRERFDRDVALEVDWEAFEADSRESGWPLYPLNIQQAGIERLLYALTGLMDRDERFRTAAIDSVCSIHITSAETIGRVQLAFRKGRLTYRCFAGDWKGYYTIEAMQRGLEDMIPRKSRLRRELERWLKEPPPAGPETTQSEQLGQPEVSKQEDPESPSPASAETASDATAEESSRVSTPAAKPEIDPYDPAFRNELESLYKGFFRAIADRDLDSLLNLVMVSRTDEETLKAEKLSDGFVSFSNWLQTAYPTLDQATFVSLKTVGDDLAGYYAVWKPSYSNSYLNLTKITYARDKGRWRIVFRLTEIVSAAVQVEKDEDTLTKVLEVLNTNPLMALEHPGSLDDQEELVVEAKVPKRLAPLKEELESAITKLYGALQQRDVESFLTNAIVSRDHEATLRKRFKKLSREILENTPDPSNAVFVKLRTIGKKKSGYYFVAPYPKNPAFKFVYLRPFVCRDGRWRMLFSLDHDVAMNMSVARSGADLVSRAEEVIRELSWLDLEWVLSELLNDIIEE